MKYCKACGKPMHDTAAHCPHGPHCGMAQGATLTASPTAMTRAPGLMLIAVIGMFLGVAPFAAFFSTPDWTPSHARGSAVIAVAALVLGCISTAKQHRARGMGIAAVSLGVLGLLMALISLQPD